MLLSLYLLGIISIQGQSSNEVFAEAAITSTHLIPGEQSYLVVRLQGGEPDSRPITPAISDTAVNFVRSNNRMNTQRQILTDFLFRITPVKPGTYTIPTMEVRSKGNIYKTPPLSFQVHPLSELTPLPTGIKNHQILAGWFPQSRSLYQGEQTPVTLKLYVPSQLPVADKGWGLPDPAKENCLAWRFSLPETNNSSQVTVDDVSYQTATFATTLSGIAPGPATFGPAPVRIVVRQSVIDPLRGSRLINTPINLTTPAISFDIKKLPEGAPDGFDGAIGDFSIRAYSQQTALQENDPTEVILRIDGRGNLETLQSPTISDEQWKIIDTTKITRGAERRDIQGVVTFRQLLRPPSAAVTEIPEYNLSYFNPGDQSYHTIQTSPIPVSITPQLNPDQRPYHPSGTTEKLGTAPDEMRGILGFINTPNRELTQQQPFSNLWHVAPLLVIALIISIPLRKKIKAAQIKHPDYQRKKEALDVLTQENDPVVFYRQAGRFIEMWLSGGSHLHASQQHADELENILTLRDNLCFHPSASKAPALKPNDKKSVMNLLKRCSKVSMIFIGLGMSLSSVKAGSSTPADAAWKDGHYEQAISLYQANYPDPANTPADILFNIGNCHHRLEHDGLATLSWRRALEIDPRHRQSRQNLRFVELEKNALVPTYSPWSRKLSLAPPSFYNIAFQSSLWFFAIASITMITLRPRQWKSASCIVIMVIAPVVATLCWLAMRAYPDDHLFASWNQQAVSLSQANFYREAHRLEKDPRTIPEASLLRIEADRGPWTYVTTSDGKVGWIESKHIEKCSP